eukprot:3175507-Rhodomonas_salina.1
MHDASLPGTHPPRAFFRAWQKWILQREESRFRGAGGPDLRCDPAPRHNAAALNRTYYHRTVRVDFLCTSVTHRCMHRRSCSPTRFLSGNSRNSYAIPR